MFISYHYTVFSLTVNFRRIFFFCKAILTVIERCPGGLSMIIAFLRTIILYLLIIAGIRLMGKRQVGELEPSELVLALIIADLAAVPMQDFGIPLLSGIIPILTLLCITMIISVLTMRSVRFRAIICGRPSIIVEDGKILQKEMKRNRFTVDELMEELRMKGVTDISTVKYAILETNGQISILPRAADLPVTASQMGIETPEPGLPVVVINDGRVLDHNLAARGLNRAWLDRQLTAHKIKSAGDVFLLTVDGQNQVYLAAKDVTAK